MDIFDRLIHCSKDSNELQQFIDRDINELYDFLLGQSFVNVNNSKERIGWYILPNFKAIKGLDLLKPSTHTFLNILLDISERFGFLIEFQRLYKLLSHTSYNVGSRLEAASLYLIGIKTSDDYLNRFAPIYQKLKLAFENEEDGNDKVITTVVNYYAQVVNNFGAVNVLVPKTLKLNIEATIAVDEFSFLNHPLMFEVLAIDLTSFEYAYLKIHSCLDIFLGRDRELPNNGALVLIENNTEYCNLIMDSGADFNSIRRIALERYASLPDRNRHFFALQRGVKILTEVEELYAYMVGYGLKHHKKLFSAFPFLPAEVYQNELKIVDWGCGQGMATMAFFEYGEKNNLDISADTICLIEPSELALKRAALHVQKANSSCDIITINKDFDSLNQTDFSAGFSTHTLHFFSNVLDINIFSHTDLIKLICESFTGVNYFICVSPYVADLTPNRFDSFVKAFSLKRDFKLIESIDNRNGEWGDCTRVLRVFKVTI